MMNAFPEIKTLSEQGFWSDSLTVDKLLIENRKCPKCGHYLTYRGFSNPTLYKAFGVCQPCEFAKQFWSEPSVFRNFKNRIAAKTGEQT